jgi:hypothetical protein
VQVRPEHDIPAILRPDGKPTTGEIREVYDDTFIVWVPIGDADIDEHSQAVPYEAHQLEVIPESS